MSLARLPLALVGETLFPPRAPFSDAVREPPGSSHTLPELIGRRPTDEP
jgi:hypothetical protein